MDINEISKKWWMRVIRLSSIVVFGWLGMLCIDKRSLVFREGTMAESVSTVMIGYALIFCAVCSVVHEIRSWKPRG